MAGERPYIPLVAGMEIVRRSGNLTQFPPDYLLGNLPKQKMRVLRVIEEALGLPGCMLPTGELITFLFYSDFGPMDQPGRTNWSWDMTQPGEFFNGPYDMVALNVAAGDPGNNLLQYQSGIFDDQPMSFVQGAIPVTTGFCTELRETVSLRLYHNGFTQDDTIITWTPTQSTIHSKPGNPGGIGELNVVEGTMLLRVLRTGNNVRFEWGSGSAGPASFGSANTTLTGVVTPGNSVFIELFLTQRSTNVGELTIHIDGVDRGTFTGDAGNHTSIARRSGALYPMIYRKGGSYDANRTSECFSIPGGFQCPTGRGTEIFTNTWKLERI